MTPAGQLAVELTRLDGLDPPGLAEEWRSLEAAVQPCPYLAFGWLQSWWEIYRPAALHVIRLRNPDGELRAAGLLEELPRRRLRFAGGPQTPVRGLLVRAEEEAAAWQALGAWLADHPRTWSWLEAEGVTAAAGALPRAQPVSTPWFGLELGSTFEDYLAARPSSTRRTLTRKLRAAERAEVTAGPVEPDQVPQAIERFVALHASRAQDKGEVHEHMDDRLSAMLARAAGAPGLRLAAVCLVQDGVTRAVTIRLDLGQGSWFYNAGFDPAASRLSPGLVVELASIRDAIARGQRSYDLGPGDYRYKRDLGGQERELLRITATSSSAAGQLARAMTAARRNPWLRARRDAVRRALSGRSSPRLGS
jgi:CelD/BcsL family acetyltransferase involved in cellulose biosynthesis